MTVLPDGRSTLYVGETLDMAAWKRAPGTGRFENACEYRLDRDGTRRGDLIRILQAANAYKEENGEYISTDGNIQTLCAFKDIDKGCEYEATLGGDVPEDPAGDPVQNGYWYQSDGQSLVLYAALELEIPDEERCRTENVDLREEPSLICLRFP